MTWISAWTFKWLSLIVKGITPVKPGVYVLLCLQLSIKCSKIFCCSVANLCLTVCDPMDCSTPGFSVLHYPLEFAQTYFHWVTAAHPLSPPFLLLPSIFPIIKVFSNESALRIRWPSIGTSVSASVLPVNIQGWFPLGLTGLMSLLSEGLSSLLQHHNLKASVFLQHSVFFMVQFSHP